MNRLQRAGKAVQFLVAAMASGLFAEKPPKPPATVHSISELEAYINRLIALGRPPSLSVVVIKGGRVVYSKAFGFADGPKHIPATNETVYQWMSMTKLTTAVSIFQLCERGKIHLDDPVKKHLPSFEVQYPSVSSQQIAIRHLLNHSSGLANPPSMIRKVHLDGGSHPSQVALAQELLTKHPKLQFEPGTQGTYTNLGYTILGAIVEAVSGQPHKDYVVENIFRPLKMVRTDYCYKDTMLADAAVGSQPNGHILSAMLPILFDNLDEIIRETVKGRMWLKRAYPDFTGAAGVIGPATETARFVSAFLNGGELEGERILSPESVATMIHEGHVVAKGGPASFYKGVQHGLGWWIWPDGERQRIMHSGDGPGFSNIMQLYPEEKLGVVVQGNEWAYGVAFSGTALRDNIAHLAASVDWA